MVNGLTKEHTKSLYGIAVLLMLFHHWFCEPSRLNYPYFSVIDSLFNRDGLEMFAARLCKVCVAFYAFISGYAYCFSCQKRNPVAVSVNRAVSFLKKYWLVCIIFLPLGVLLGKLEFDKSLFFHHFLLTDTSYNGEWWYASFYVKLLICLPFIDYSVKKLEDSLAKYKHGKLLVIVAAVVISHALSRLLGLSRTYLWIALEGYLAAKYGIFQWMTAKQSSRKFLRFLQWFLLLVISIRLRCMFTTESGSHKIDLLVTLPLIYCIMEGIRHSKAVMSWLAFFGKYSTYIWLTHTFFLYYYFQSFSMISGNSLIMFIQSIVTSTLTAMLLSKAEQVIATFGNPLKENSNIMRR